MLVRSLKAFFQTPSPCYEMWVHILSTVAVAELLNVHVLHAWSTEEPSTNSCYLGADTQEKTGGVQFQSESEAVLPQMHPKLALSCNSAGEKASNAGAAMGRDCPRRARNCRAARCAQRNAGAHVFLYNVVTGMTLIEILIRLIIKWFVLVGVCMRLEGICRRNSNTRMLSLGLLVSSTMIRKSKV